MSTNTQAPAIASSQPISAGFLNVDGFALIQRVGQAFAGSDLIPPNYQGNLPNCMIALDMANRMGANPLMVMQNLYVVHGNPSFSSKFLIASINTSGKFSSLRYEDKGEQGTDDYGYRAWAIERETGERLNGVWITWKMVKAEGWDKKNGSKWKTMPDQMFIYRAAAFWQRAYAPEISMGFITTEEAYDMVDTQSDGTVIEKPSKPSETVQMPRSKSKVEPKATPAEVVQSAKQAEHNDVHVIDAELPLEEMATDGEKTLLRNKFESVSMSMSMAVDGTDCDETLDGLTKSTFNKLLQFANELANQ